MKNHGNKLLKVIKIKERAVIVPEKIDMKEETLGNEMDCGCPKSVAGKP